MLWAIVGNACFEEPNLQSIVQRIRGSGQRTVSGVIGKLTRGFGSVAKGRTGLKV